MELDVLLVCTIMITVAILILQSFLLFVFLTVATFFAIKWVLDRSIASCRARRTPFQLDWLSNLVDYVLQIRTLISSMIIKSDSAGIDPLSPFKAKRSFCKRSDSIEDEIETIVDCIVDEYILIWLEVVTPSNRDFSDDCRVVFKQIFMDLIDKFLKNADRDKFLAKVINLLSDTICDPFTAQSLSIESETELVRNMVEELLILIDFKEVNELKLVRCTDKQQRDSLYILIRDLLTQAVVMPITAIITDPNWINEQICDLLDDSERSGVGHPLALSSPEIKLTGDEYHKKLPQGPLNSVYSVADRQLSLDNSRRASSASMERSSSTSPQHKRLDYIKSEGMRRSLSADIYLGQMRKDPVLSTSEEDLADCESGIEVGADMNEAMAMDNRLFTNVRIEGTEEVRTRTEQYTLYYVFYDGLAEVMVENESKSYVKFVRKEMSVKRRFREFVNLQNRLEDNPQLRPYLRRIKKPSKLRVTTNTIFGGTKLDRETIAYRRMFLEKFMIDLCNREPIANSKEMRQFLAYGSDARKTYVNPKNALIAQVPRIDRVIMDGLKGAFTMIKNTLPVELAFEGQPLWPGQNSLRKGLGDVHTRIGDSMHLELYLLRWDLTELALTHQNSQEPSPPSLRSSFSGSLHKQSVDSDAIGPNGSSGSFNFSHIPLASAIVDFFNVIYYEASIVTSIYTVLFKAVFGNVVERLIVKQVSEHVTRANAVYLLHLLHESVWSDFSDVINESRAKTATVTSATNCATNCTTNLHDAALNRTNTKDVPMPATVGDTERLLLAYCSQKLPMYSLLASKVNRAINYVLNSLQSQERNKLFVYQLLHVITLEMKRTAPPASGKSGNAT